MKILQIIGYICILAASMVLGNWFLSEIRRAKATGKPWFTPYLSIPGLLILVIVLLLPIIARII
jgi:H+/Cl- antiporter ClcA